MPQQNNQNTQQTMQMMNRAEPYMPSGTPDETWYTMPMDTGPAREESWESGGQMVDFDAAAPAGGPVSYMAEGPAGMQNANMQNTAFRPAQGQGMGGTVAGAGMSSRHAQSQRMKNPLDMAATHNPANSAEAYQASLRSLLARNVGYYIVCTFLIGTQRAVTWQGILHTVGSDYLVLYQPDFERYISCDLYALKFAQFHNVKTMPYCASAQTQQGQSAW